MGWNIILPLTVPFLGTVIGAGAVLGLPLGSERVQRGLNGFAAGAMLAALQWNLLLPGQTLGAGWALAGLLLGIGCVTAAGRLPERLGTWGSPGLVLMLALVLHNIPEGMAVGLSAQTQHQTMIGIALQNIPDGAVAAVPLAAMGIRKKRAFLGGVLSGAVEPIAALAAMGLQGDSGPFMALMMGFAAGAMLNVVVGELLPRMGGEEGGMGWFCLGFAGIMGLSGIT